MPHGPWMGRLSWASPNPRVARPLRSARAMRCAVGAGIAPWRFRRPASTHLVAPHRITNWRGTGSTCPRAHVPRQPAPCSLLLAPCCPFCGPRSRVLGPGVLAPRSNGPGPRTRGPSRITAGRLPPPVTSAMTRRDEVCSRGQEQPQGRAECPRVHIPSPDPVWPPRGQAVSHGVQTSRSGHDLAAVRPDGDELDWLCAGVTTYLVAVRPGGVSCAPGSRAERDLPRPRHVGVAALGSVHTPSQAL